MGVAFGLSKHGFRAVTFDMRVVADFGLSRHGFRAVILDTRVVADPQESFSKPVYE